MRFLLVKAQSQYGSLRLHVDQLADALRALGEDVRVVDAMEPFGTAAFVCAVVVDGADCVFTFGGVYGQEYGPVFKTCGITYASLYVDNPLHHLPRLEPPAAQYVAFFLDRTHQALVQALDQTGAFAHLGFLPPGANTLAAPVDVSREAYGPAPFQFCSAAPIAASQSGVGWICRRRSATCSTPSPSAWLQMAPYGSARRCEMRSNPAASS